MAARKRAGWQHISNDRVYMDFTVCICFAYIDKNTRRNRKPWNLHHGHRIVNYSQEISNQEVTWMQSFWIWVSKRWTYTIDAFLKNVLLICTWQFGKLVHKNRTVHCQCTLPIRCFFRSCEILIINLNKKKEWILRVQMSESRRFTFLLLFITRTYPIFTWKKKTNYDKIPL